MFFNPSMIINLFFFIVHGMTTTFIGKQDRFWGSHKWLPYVKGFIHVAEDSDGGSSGSEDAPFGHLELQCYPVLAGSGSSKQPPNSQISKFFIGLMWDEDGWGCIQLCIFFDISHATGDVKRTHYIYWSPRFSVNICAFFHVWTQSWLMAPRRMERPMPDRADV